MKKSLYLAQSYSDSWSDYQRSLKVDSFPVWDYVILTASNEHQARSFEAQLDCRKDRLPSRTKFAVIPDEGGRRVGSGGATLSVLKYIREREDSFKGLRILVIHSGGDSKRVPQYSALGKLFSPVPHCLPDGHSSTLFDEFIIAMSSVPSRIREGMLLLAGDVLLLFNPLLIDWSGSGAAAISFKENVSTGSDHGVFLKGRNGNVAAFLHKQKEPVLRLVGAVNSAGDVDIDTGAVMLGVDVLDSLYSLICRDGMYDPDRYKVYVNDKVRLSLYGDFQYPMAEDSTLEEFYEQAPEGEYCQELKEAREALWNVLRPYRMKLLRLAPAKFIHFGTTGEILHLMNSEVEGYSELGWSNRVNCSMDVSSGYNSVVSPGASVGSGCYLEVSYVHSKAVVGNNCVLSYIDIHDEVIPDGVVLHGLKQQNGRFVCRIFGVEDNPKGDRLFDKKLTGNLWSDGEEHTLWNANIYKECDTIPEAVAAALKLYETVMEGRDISGNGQSMRSGFANADPEAVLAWNRRMEEIARMNDIATLIHEHKPVSDAVLSAPLTKVQKKWLDGRLSRASFGEAMRLYYYVGTAIGDESLVSKAFSVLSTKILDETLAGLKENTSARIRCDELEVELPLRVNFGGGWSDTPPYCNEKGGTVINAAVTLSGRRPVKVALKRLDEHRIVFDSRDMDVHGEFTDITQLQSVGDPYDPYVLQKAALLACGVIPESGGDLEIVLDRLGGGIWIDTEVVGVPKGSGLGTSSILAAAVVKALYDFLGIPYTEDLLYSTVLCMEQIMSTGGGWQDQIGGVTDGIKYISSRPGLKQEIRVDHLALDEETTAELNERFTLIYTGQRRLARNLLRDVVGRYIGNEPDNVFALNEIQRVASLMRFELERGNVDAFAELLSRHWELSKMIDAGSTNTLIDQIFDSCDDLLAGRMVCGAGGGGFLQVVLARGVTREELHKRLKEVFSDTDIGVWKCELV